jgi:hypothetical protein
MKSNEEWLDEFKQDNAVGLKGIPSAWVMYLRTSAYEQAIRNYGDVDKAKYGLKELIKSLENQIHDAEYKLMCIDKLSEE